MTLKGILAKTGFSVGRSLHAANSERSCTLLCDAAVRRKGIRFGDQSDFTIKFRHPLIQREQVLPQTVSRRRKRALRPLSASSSPTGIAARKCHSSLGAANPGPAGQRGIQLHSQSLQAELVRQFVLLS